MTATAFQPPHAAGRMVPESTVPELPASDAAAPAPDTAPAPQAACSAPAPEPAAPAPEPAAPATESAAPLGLARIAQGAADALAGPGVCGVLLTVPAGLGAEPLLRDVLDATGMAHVAVRGMAGLKDKPFGALAPLLSGGTSLNCPLQVLADVRAHLAEQAGEAPVVVVVRNAAELDEATVNILIQLCARPGVKLLVHTRSHGCLPEGFALLAADGQLATVEMPQLQAREIQEWCRSETGTYTPYVTAMNLQQATAGNPVFISYLLRDATTRAQMRVEENVRILERPLVPSPTMTADVVGLLDGYSVDEREVLTAVALAGKLELCTLGKIWDPEAFNNLLLERVLVRVRDGSERVTVEPALLSDAIAATSGVFTRTALWQRLGPFLREATAPEAELARVQWQLSIGERPGAGELVSAAATSNRLDDPHTAMALLDELDDVAAGWDGMLQRSRALFYLGSVDAALQCASKLVEGGPDGYEGLSSYDHLLTLLAQIRLSTGHGAELFHAAGRHWKDMEAGGAGTAGDRERHLLMFTAVEQLAQGVASPAALAAALSEDADAGGREGLVGHLLLVEAAARTGDIAGAADHLDTALEWVLADEELRNYGSYILNRLLLVLCLGGYWDRTDVWLERLAQPGAPWLRQLAGLGELVTGIRLLQQGRAADAMEALHAAVVTLRHHDTSQLLPVATAVAACTAGMSGDAEAAAVYQQEYRDLSCAGMPLAAGFAQAFAAAARTPDMDPEAVRAELWQLLAEASDAGARRTEIETTALLLQFDRSVPPSRLAELTAGVEDPRAKALHAYALALETAADADLLAAGETAAELGQCLIAATALAQVILPAGERRHRIPPQTAALLARLHPQAQELYPQLLQLRTRSKLTTREKEIVAGIAAGRTSRQLAADAGVSVRTIDGHVHRIMGKLGVNSRKDLQNKTAE